MKLIDGTVKLNKKIIVSTFLSHDAVLAYTGLCIATIQLDKNCLDISVEDIAHYLGFKKIKWYALHRISRGLEELRYNTVVVTVNSGVILSAGIYGLNSLFLSMISSPFCIDL